MQYDITGSEPDSMQVSVVIPAFDEAGNIGPLVEETFTAVPADLLGEVIVVDDCSGDTTASEVRDLMAKYPKLRLLMHSANAGQSTCLRTGIGNARYPVIATMDGDGQNDPHDIPKMIATLSGPDVDREGVAMVGGVRARRKNTASRKIASRFANWLRGAILQDDCPDTGCGIKVYWRDAFMQLPFFTSIHRFLPALFKVYGYNVRYVPVNDRPRLAGYSKYTNLGRAVIGFYDLFGIVWLRRRTKNPHVQEYKQ
jgi:dolichol-phosphate mannosyltransferase